MKETKRQHTATSKPASATSNDAALLEKRTTRAMASAVRWLRRRGSQRENSHTKRAYIEAAKRINGLTRG